MEKMFQFFFVRRARQTGTRGVKIGRCYLITKEDRKSTARDLNDGRNKTPALWTREGRGLYRWKAVGDEVDHQVEGRR